MSRPAWATQGDPISEKKRNKSSCENLCSVNPWASVFSGHQGHGGAFTSYFMTSVLVELTICDLNPAADTHSVAIAEPHPLSPTLALLGHLEFPSGDLAICCCCLLQRHPQWSWSTSQLCLNTPLWESCRSDCGSLFKVSSEILPSSYSLKGFRRQRKA